MKSGLGIRPELFEAVEQNKPDFGFLEAHSENYFGDSHIRHRLIQLRQSYPISLHGVGLSLGRADDLNAQHLYQLKQLADEIDPLFVSEHLAWSAYAHRHVPDLLPLPLTESALALVCEHVDQMQTVLGRTVLIENPSNYLLFDQLQIPEPEFLNELARRTGCGLLLDVNNVYVSAANLKRSAQEYMASLNSDLIGQYHLAGHTPITRQIDGAEETLLIDTHSAVVESAVWELFDSTLKLHGARPTLIEWDSDFPDFSVLMNECAHANSHLFAIAPQSKQQASREIDSKIQAKVRSDIKQAFAETDLPTFQTEFLDAVINLELSLSTVQTAHQHRISVYRNNAFGAALNYLISVFPATQGVVGESFFKQMCKQFVQLNPPSQGNIHTYGEGFEHHVNTLDEVQGLAYLPDLIRYEWALHSAYCAEHEDVLRAYAIPQGELLTLPIVLHASVTILKSDFPILEIYRQSLPSYDGEVSIDLAQSKDCLAVFKQDYEVKTERFSESFYEVVRTIGNSDTLLRAMNRLQSSLEEQEIASALQWVFERGFLAHRHVELTD